MKKLYFIKQMRKPVTRPALEAFTRSLGARSNEVTCDDWREILSLVHHALEALRPPKQAVVARGASLGVETARPHGRDFTPRWMLDRVSEVEAYKQQVSATVSEEIGHD